jgi:FG-GAP-like repeat
VTGSLGTTQSFHYSTIAAWVDLNGDGWDDIVHGDGFVRQNEQGTGFRDISIRSNLSLVAQLSEQKMGPSVVGLIPADFDRDGKIDLFIARGGPRPKSWLEETSQACPPCQLLRNLGNWRFEDVTDRMGPSVMGRNVFSAVWSDFNNDGWPDLYSINEFGDGIMYFNRDGLKFDNFDIDNQISSFGAMGVTSGDFDNDGNVDIYAGEMYSKAGSRVIGNMKPDAYAPEVMTRLRSLVDGSELYRNLGNEKFEGVGKKMQVRDVGWAWGPVSADFDNNGLLDIYATAGYISRDRDKPDG